MDTQHEKSVAVTNEAVGSKSYAWAVFALLFALMIFDFIDRQIVVSMLPLIKADWELSDTQLGALISVVPLTVGLCAIPIAILADNWSRVKCIFVMAFVWSLATVACAFATNYAQLLALRSLVGVGEAGYGAVGAALLASLFPSHMRATILAAFAAAAVIGAVLGVAIGGVISSHWGWHAAFGVVGAPGLLLALLVLLVREDKTVGIDPSGRGTAKPGIALREIASVLLSTPSALIICLGGACQLFVASTIGSWLPSYLSRAYGLPADQAGLKAAIVMLTACLGAILWGWLADRVSRTNPRNKVWLMAASTFSGFVVLTTAFGFMSPGPQQFALIVLGALFGMGTLGPVAAVVVDVVPSGIRATALAVAAVVQNLLGLAAGPFVSGVISDSYGLAFTLAVVPSFGLAATVIFLLTVPAYERDLSHSRKRDLQAVGGGL